jgi:sugar (pentulose or hexulose) kinase
MTADAVRRPVVAGPSEATAIGNAIVQLIALGKIGSLAEARAALAASQALVTYEPRHAATWDDAYQRFRGVLAQ